MCATAMGSTFSHRPFPGVRKSGIPDGTEIPAPVSTTADEAARSSEASSATPKRPAVPPIGRIPGRFASTALELRLPLAQERSDPLLRVLGLERRRKALRLGLEALGDLGLRRDRLDLFDRKRRLLGQLARPGESGVEQLVVGHDFVREPDAL